MMMEPSKFRLSVWGGPVKLNMLEVNKITKKKVKLKILTALECMPGFRKCGVGRGNPDIW